MVSTQWQILSISPHAVCNTMNNKAQWLVLLPLSWLFLCTYFKPEFNLVFPDFPSCPPFNPPVCLLSILTFPYTILTTDATLLSEFNQLYYRRINNSSSLLHSQGRQYLLLSVWQSPGLFPRMKTDLGYPTLYEKQWRFIR